MSLFPKRAFSYLNCIIYKVSSVSRPDLVYYGFTTEGLKKRFIIHNAKTNRTSSKQIINIGDAYIKIVEAYPCFDKLQAEKRERYYIESFNCVNKVCPGQTPRERYQKFKHEKRNYYIKHKTRIRRRIYLRYRRKQSELLYNNIRTFTTSSNSHHLLNTISKLFRSSDKFNQKENNKILSRTI